MNVLIVGGGGREDALTWALRRDAPERKLVCAPGNAGTDRHAERCAIDATDVDRLVEHVRDGGYDLVVVGPEAPLVEGLADRLRALGVPTFGPGAAAARLEGSKIFAKEFLVRHGIPTARSRTFDDETAAVAFLESADAILPCVVKADGLAAGKGVLIADDRDAAIAAVRKMLGERAFGSAGDRILIEEKLTGREASWFVLTDGKTAVGLAPCQDYKRALDGDAGPNTGGMGTYSPSAFLDDATRDRIEREIVAATIAGLERDGLDYRGVIFVGLMLTDDGPKVLEYNVRFGDPETQVLMPRLDGDWGEVLAACAEGRLGDVDVAWTDDAAVCVVMAAGGYPGAYGTGDPIEGLDAAERLDGVVVFHAGTALDGEGRVVTSGGRVLGVTAVGPDLAAARRKAYDAVAAISWRGARHRNDIAADALTVMQETEG